MNGFHIQKTIRLCLLSFIATGSMVFAELKDTPDRFEKGLRGIVVEIGVHDQGRIMTLRLDELDTLISLDVAKDAEVWRAYEKGRFEKVETGEYVGVRLAKDHRTVREIHVQGGVRDVVIQKVDTSSGVLTVAKIEEGEEKPSDETHDVKLAPDVILRIGGLPAALMDFKPGMKVPLEFGVDGNTINAIEADMNEELIVYGSITELDAEKGVVTVKSEGDGEEKPQLHKLWVPKEAILLQEDRVTSLNEIKIGSEVIVRMTDDKKSVRVISATLPAPEEPENKSDIVKPAE